MQDQFLVETIENYYISSKRVICPYISTLSHNIIFLIWNRSFNITRKRKSVKRSCDFNEFFICFFMFSIQHLSFIQCCFAVCRQLLKTLERRCSFVPSVANCCQWIFCHLAAYRYKLSKNVRLFPFTLLSIILKFCLNVVFFTLQCNGTLYSRWMRNLQAFRGGHKTHAEDYCHLK